MTSLKWKRTFPNSTNNFDLMLSDSAELDVGKVGALLEQILLESHRRLSLSSRAVSEFRRWLQQPDTPLKSEAYVLLSNWFLTQSGDRQSTVASQCENLWDALFACRPAQRLSSPEAGRNHAILPLEFESFWRRLLECQGDHFPEGDKPSGGAHVEGNPRTSGEPIVSQASSTDRIRAKFDKEGLHCEVEGSSRAVADFLKKVSGWNGG